MSNPPAPKPQPSTAADCAQAHALLSAIEHQKAAFDAALREATTSGDFSPLESLGADLQEKLNELDKLTQSIEIPQKIEAARAWVQAFEQQNGLEHDPDHFLTCEVGGMSAEELITAIENTPEATDSDTKMQIDIDTKEMLQNVEEFIPTETQEQMYFIRLTVADLGFSEGVTITEIFTKAKELGLELCPPDAGPHLRLHLTNQPMNEYLYMGMNPITKLNSALNVFGMERSSRGSYLTSDDAGQEDIWFRGHVFIFRIPQHFEERRQAE